MGSQEIPTTARPPPAAVLKNRGGQWANSPPNRNKVIPKVMTAGTRISPRMLRVESELDSAMHTSTPHGLVMTASAFYPILPAGAIGRSLLAR